MHRLLKYRTTILFGVALAILFFFLEFIEYRFFLGQLSTEIYTGIIALFFSAIGIWIGLKIIERKKNAPNETKEIDQEALENLGLKSREYEILQLIAKGHTNQQIADSLFIALPTVKTHVSNLYTKLDVQNRTHAIHKARELNIL